MKQQIPNRTIFCHDNIEILRGMDSQSVDLIYLDPPFNKKRNFHAPIGSKSEGASFKDVWYEEDNKDEWIGLIADDYPILHDFLEGIAKIGDKSNKYYLVYMAIRMLELKRILKDTGSIYIHCDNTMSHYLKLLMDCIFGDDQFRNEIVWGYKLGGRPSKGFARKHDIIYLYSKTEHWNFYAEQVKIPYESTGGYISSGRKIVNGKEYKLNPSGKTPEDWWPIPALNHNDKERQGYPTQKPLQLLERIIQASSKEGDIVLDPFCGCATTCIAAEKLGRNWIGIDVSPKAFDLVKIRLTKEVADEGDMFKRLNNLVFREDIPQRTDLIKSPAKKTEVKHKLYGKQRGHCNGCNILFEYRNLTIDHILPKKRGGQDNEENLQLLCGSCNSIKNENDMAYLMGRLREFKIIR